jgi:hypothetical protein
MSHRSLVLSLALLAPAPLLAQGNPQAPVEACTAAAPPQRVSASFNTAADMIRVPLCGGWKYIAETDRGNQNIRLDIQPLTAGVQKPMIREGMMGADTQGGRSWVLDVKTSGVFQVALFGVQGGIPVTLTITPRVDMSKQNAEKAAKDSAKAAEKAAKDSAKAAEKARKAAEKAGQGS